VSRRHRRKKLNLFFKKLASPGLIFSSSLARLWQRSLSGYTERLLSDNLLRRGRDHLILNFDIDADTTVP
jgi:hypothetical protein